MQRLSAFDPNTWRGEFHIRSPQAWHYRAYEYWRHNSLMWAPIRENFCHYWRVVLFWAPLTWVVRREFSSLKVLPLLVIGLIFSLFADLSTTVGLAVFLGVEIYVAVLTVIWGYAGGQMEKETVMGAVIMFGLVPLPIAALAPFWVFSQGVETGLRHISGWTGFKWVQKLLAWFESSSWLQAVGAVLGWAVVASLGVFFVRTIRPDEKLFAFGVMFLVLTGVVIAVVAVTAALIWLGKGFCWIWQHRPDLQPRRTWVTGFFFQAKETVYFIGKVIWAIKNRMICPWVILDFENQHSSDPSESE